MLATLYLFACTLATAQSAATDNADGILTPRLTRGQELVYRGTYHEDSNGDGVQFNRGYRMESRALILETRKQEADVVFLTMWKSKPANPDPKADPEVNSVQLEKGGVDANGRVSANGGSWLSVPLDGPPTIETGAFVEVPRGPVQVEQFWDVPDGGRPPYRWQVVGFETVGGGRCVKLAGTQQSDDWDKPRADRTAWRRQDTVWITPKAGFTQRVERTIERREPAHKNVTFKAVLKYELESSLQYPGPLFEDRRREITQALTLGETVAGMLPRAGELGPRPFENVLKRIEFHYQQHPPTPYRDALRRVQLLAEKGKRGEVPPEVPVSEGASTAQTLSAGRPAPDFVVNDLIAGGTARLKHYLGKPVLLVFYNPKSPAIDDILTFAQHTSDESKGAVTVIGMAVSEDVDFVLTQHSNLRLGIPVLSGMGLHLSYRVDGTPKLVVIDAQGMVRNTYTGWGAEIPASVAADLKRCFEK